MLYDMRQLALDYLNQELEPQGPIPDDIEAWYRSMQVSGRARLFPYLVESGERVPCAYIITQSEADLLSIQVEQIVANDQGGGCPASFLPFLKPTGSQSPAIGPVIKRTYAAGKGAGPSSKILRSTVKSLQSLAESSQEWSSYFRDVLRVFSTPRLRLLDGSIINWADQYFHPFEAVVYEIGPQRDTVFVTVRTATGRLPGEDTRYLQYLFDVVLAGSRYTTKATPEVPHQTCALCETQDVVVYSNGVKGAGINIVNADRDGSFPGLTSDNAWKRYAICRLCSDLLFVFHSHVLKRRGEKRIRANLTDH
ncbi:MAG: TM1802 family CRISPR-associated protein [Sulfobacillus sp.]